MSERSMSTAEAGMPWITYYYGLTHDLWWPFWNSTRVLGRMRIGVACAVCGDEKVLSLRIPRFGNIPDQGHHSVSEQGPQQLLIVASTDEPDPIPGATSPPTHGRNANPYRAALTEGGDRG